MPDSQGVLCRWGTHILGDMWMGGIPRMSRNTPSSVEGPWRCLHSVSVGVVWIGGDRVYPRCSAPRGCPVPRGQLRGWRHPSGTPCPGDALHPGAHHAPVRRGNGWGGSPGHPESGGTPCPAGQLRAPGCRRTAVPDRTGTLRRGGVGGRSAAGARRVVSCPPTLPPPPRAVRCLRLISGAFVCTGLAAPACPCRRL